MAPDPGTQATDAIPDPILVGWLPGRRIRLLVADDNTAARAGLRGMLESQPDFEVVGEATTGTEVVQLTDRLHPRVVLMDLHMPQMDATEAIAEIKVDHPDTRTLVVSTYDSDADILPAIEAGASGYLLKDAPREELFDAVRAAAQGKPLP
jgi:DNA-binding NarL/FixJ family response regulator